MFGCVYIYKNYKYFFFFLRDHIISVLSCKRGLGELGVKKQQYIDLLSE